MPSCRAYLRKEGYRAIGIKGHRTKGMEMDVGRLFVENSYFEHCDIVATHRTRR